MVPDKAGPQHRPPVWPGVLGVAVLSAILVGAVVAVAAWKNVPMSSLTRDPVESGGLRWHAGFLHSISILVWGALTASCLLGAATWRRSGGERVLRAFLLVAAALTLLVGLDDIFQFRGELYPDHLGLSEVAVLVIYAVVLCILAVVFGPTMLRTEWIVLAAAVAVLVVWLGVRHFDVERAVQDGLKLVGQLTLLLYFFRTSVYGLNPR